MKKFNRIFKKKLKKISFHTQKEVLEIKQWIIDLVSINILILKSKENGVNLENQQAKRGEIYHVDFGYNIGSEYRYNHFCAVIQTTGSTVLIMPLTSAPDNRFAIDLGYIDKIPGASKKSYGLGNQITSISRSRLKTPKNSFGKKVYPKLKAPQLDLIDDFIKNYILSKK